MVEKNEKLEIKQKPSKNYFRTFIVTGGITATLITGIIKGPEYITKLNPKSYEETTKMLNDTTFQKYLQQRANSAGKFLDNQEKYNSRQLESYLNAIYGRNPLE